MSHPGKIFCIREELLSVLANSSQNFPARKIAILILPKSSSLRKVFKIDSSQNSQSGKNLQKWFFLKFPDWKNPTLPHSGISLHLHSCSFFQGKNIPTGKFFSNYPNWNPFQHPCKAFCTLFTWMFLENLWQQNDLWNIYTYMCINPKISYEPFHYDFWMCISLQIILLNTIYMISYHMLL